MHAILRRCLELETRSTLETSFEIKVDQKQRVLLLLACYFHSPAINKVLQLEIRSPPIGALDASKRSHPPIYPPGTAWMQSLRDYGSWRKLSSSGARNMRLAPIRCNHPPNHPPKNPRAGPAGLLVQFPVLWLVVRSDANRIRERLTKIHFQFACVNIAWAPAERRVGKKFTHSICLGPSSFILRPANPSTLQSCSYPICLCISVLDQSVQSFSSPVQGYSGCSQAA